MNPSLPSDKCHLLSLPPELRLRIYEYLYSHTISSQSVDWRWSYVVPLLRPQLTALLRTCKTIHREAAPVLYGNLNASLVVTNFDHLRYFPGKFPLQLASHMKLVLSDLWYGAEDSWIARGMWKICSELEGNEGLKTCVVEVKGPVLADTLPRHRRVMVQTLNTLWHQLMLLDAKYESSSAPAKFCRAALECAEKKLKASCWKE